MKKIIQTLGSIVFSLFLYSIPISLVLSFVYKWELFFKVMFTLIFMLQFFAVCTTVYDKANKDE